MDREMLQQMEINQVQNKKDRIRIKASMRDKTVIVKVTCSIDPATKKTLEEFDMAWTAAVNWKQGGIRGLYLIDGTLGDIVTQVYKVVKERLIDLMGRIQEVDVVFHMPSGKDHQTTITFKQAMRSIHN